MKIKLPFIALLLFSFALFAQTSNYHGGIYGFSEDLVYVVADGGRFFKSENSGLSWDEFDSGVNVEFYDLNFVDENIGFAVGQAGTILKTSNGGLMWAEVSSGTSNDLYSIGIGSLNNIYVVGDSGTILKSTDEGENWSALTGVSSERLNSINFKDVNIAYIAGDNGTLLYTDNRGANWETLDAGNTDDYYIASITENSVKLLSGPARGYLFRDGEQLLTSSNNVDWNMYSMAWGIPAPISGFHFQNDNEGYAVHSADMLCECCLIEILKTNDGGTSWEPLYNEEFGMYGCNTQTGFSAISFVNDQYGYVLIGNVVITITPQEIFSNSIILETNEFERTANFIIYPNPAGKTINLQLKNLNPENVSMDIRNIAGKIIFSSKINQLNETLDISELSSGLYFVSLKKNGKTLGFQKLVKN